MSPGWINVVLGGKRIGYVYSVFGVWVAVLDPDDHTGREVGRAADKDAAERIVKVAYLRT